MGSRAIEKSRKLRRYGRKDYSQVVDFPVEIVGRDGVVRRYSFEESVRLYQRRIASADSRYRDSDIARAESEHCRRRIEQLRRSYFARYGWSALQATSDGEDHNIGPLAGEVAAFLRRCLETPDEKGLDDLELSALEADEDRDDHTVDRRIFYAWRPEDDTRHLLYVFRFADASTNPTREAFFTFLKTLQHPHQGGGSIEGLIAFHHSADCGLILTGRGATARPMEAEPLAEAWPTEAEDDLPDLLREGMLLLRRGEREEALRRFSAAYEQNHYRRAAYIGAAVVADQLGEHAEAETAALMGSRYFPDDAALHYHLAIARLRRGEPDEAADALMRARELGGDRYGVRLLEALIALRAGRLFRGRRLLRQLRRTEPASAPVLPRPTDSDSPDAKGGSQKLDPDAALAQSARWVRAQLAARSMLRGLGWAGVIIGVVMVGLGMVWAIGISVISSLLLPGAHAAWQRQYYRLLATPGSTGLRLADAHHLRQAFSSEQRPM
ncbi:MAG: tetratricopeptide (TPR) repeat protein [Myxococcota bacterium]|jgi:tetratricopeptide (TPR) repeat protein